MALTAYDSPGLRARMVLEGVNAYAAKPIDLRDLAPLVREMLQKVQQAGPASGGRAENGAWN